MLNIWQTIVRALFNALINECELELDGELLQQGITSNTSAALYI
jgi:hypothetical protein